MQLIFSYDKKQVIQGLRLHFIGRREVRILIILVNVFAIFAAAMFYFHKVNPLAFLLSSVLWMAIMAAFWFILPGSVYKRTSTFQEKFIMHFYDHLVTLENERGHVEWQWKNFSRYMESSLFFYLYFDSKSFFLVPKEAARQSGNLENLRILLKEKIVSQSV